MGNPKILNVAQPKGAAANKATSKIRTLEFGRMQGADTAAEIAAELNRSGYKTARGGLWTKSNVYRALNKLDGSKNRAKLGFF